MAIIDIFQKHTSSLLDRSSERILRTGRNWAEDQLGGGNTARAITDVASKYLDAEWNASSKLNSIIDKILGIGSGGELVSRPFSIGGSVPILNMVDENDNSPTIVLSARDSIESEDSVFAGNNTSWYGELSSRHKAFLRNEIILPIPNDLVNNRTFQWEGRATKNAGTILHDAFANIDVASDGLSGSVQKIKNSGVGTLLGTQIKRAVLGTLLGDAAKNREEFISKDIVNDQKRMMFKGTDFRTFNFEFDLIPKNAKDVIYMMALTKALEYHASPDLGKGALMIKYPSTWDIEFKNADGGDLDLMLNIKPCVISSLSFNYTPDGLWRTFKTGHPIHMKITIGFTETELIYKSGMIDKGILGIDRV